MIFTNGIGGSNNSQSYKAGYSAFTVSMRPATSQITFDRQWFTIVHNGKQLLTVYFI